MSLTETYSRFRVGKNVADSHIIVARWRKYFSQLFNVHTVKDVRQLKNTQQNH